LVVAGAAKGGRAINARNEAELIRKRHPMCGMSEDEVAAEIAERAKERGLVGTLS
jgi:hypothetical protein